MSHRPECTCFEAQAEGERWTLYVNERGISTSPALPPKTPITVVPESLLTAERERREAAEAELERLVEALRYIAGFDVGGMEPHQRSEDVARSALSAYEEGK